MTETQWLTSANPAPMLKHIGPKASARKLRLVGVACCRLLGAYFDDPELAAVLDAVERHTDGGGSLDEWAATVRAAERLGADAVGDATPAGAARIAVRAVASTPAAEALGVVLSWAQAARVRAAAPGEYRTAVRAAQRPQADLFREVFGNPFLERTVVPAWMSTGGSAIFAGLMLRVSETAKALADGIEADQAYERLPILADALEEAGCTDADLLSHLREPGHHVRGCWALDLVLGKG